MVQKKMKNVSNKIEEDKLIELLQNEFTRHKAFETLVRTYSEPLYWQIRRMVLTHEDTNDLLQDTFMKAWTNIHTFRGESKLSTWLYRIAINESLTFIGKKRAIQNINIYDSECCMLDNLKSDPYFSGDEIQLKLQKALHTLPEKQRLVFNMKYFQDMKYEDISAILETSVGALKASYHHAVKKIELFFEHND